MVALMKYNEIGWRHILPELEPIQYLSSKERGTWAVPQLKSDPKKSLQLPEEVIARSGFV